MSSAWRAAHFLLENRAVRDAPATFCTISCQRVTLQQLFARFHASASRSSNFLHDFMPARDALRTFRAISCQRVTLYVLFEQNHAFGSFRRSIPERKCSGGSPAAQFLSGNALVGAPLLNSRAEMLWWEPRYSIPEQKCSGGSPATHFSSKKLPAGVPLFTFRVKSCWRELLFCPFALLGVGWWTYDCAIVSII